MFKKFISEQCRTTVRSPSVKTRATLIYFNLILINTLRQVETMCVYVSALILFD